MDRATLRGHGEIKVYIREVDVEERNKDSRRNFFWFESATSFCVVHDVHERRSNKEERLHWEKDKFNQNLVL